MIRACQSALAPEWAHEVVGLLGQGGMGQVRSKDSVVVGDHPETGYGTLGFTRVRPSFSTG